MIVLLFPLGDIAEGDDNAGNDVGERAVRPHPHDEGRALVFEFEFVFDDLKRPLHLPDIVAQLVVGQHRDNVGDRPSAIAVA